MKSTETKRGAISNHRRILRPLSLGVFAIAGIVASYSFAATQAPSLTQVTNTGEKAKSDELKSIKKLEAAIAKLNAAVAKAEALAKKPDEQKGPASGDPSKVEEKKDRTERLKGLLYQLKLRAYPNDYVDESAYKRAVEHVKKMPPANWLRGGVNGNTAGGGGGAVSKASGDLLTSGAKWEFIGPTNLGDNGRVGGVAYDRLLDNRAYVTGAQGGLWQTKDGGTSWKSLTNADNYKFPQYATACAVHPNDSNILYIGMGDFNGYSGGGTADGLRRSVDGGVTWFPWPSAPAQRLKISEQCVSAIQIDPENPSQMIITTGRGARAGGIYRSTDGGASFTEETPTGLNGDWSGLEYSSFRDPVTNNRVYYATLVGRGVFYSTNNGDTWQNANAPLAFNTVNTPAGLLGLRVAASKVTQGKVYVIDASGTSIDGRVFMGTHTTGLTPTWSWVDTTGNYPLEGPESSTFDQAWYDLHITTVRTSQNKDLVYSGAVFLAASPDGSPNWTQVGGMHVDQQAMIADSRRSNTALLGNDGGAYSVTFNPTGGNFILNSLNRTLGITQFYKADWDRTNANLIIGGTQDNGTFQLNSAAWRFVGGGDGAGCAIHLTNSNIQFASSQEGNLRATLNNWASSIVLALPPWWADTTNRVSQASEPPFIGTNEVSPAPGNAGNFMYYGTQYLWRWNTTAGWLRNTATPPLMKPMGNQSLTAGGFVTAIAISQSDLLDRGGNVVTVPIGQLRYAVTAGNVVYAGTSDGRLWYTQNAMDTDVDADHTITWTEIAAGALPDRAITSITIDPKNPADILVGLGGTAGAGQPGHVFRSTNALSADVRFTDRSGFSNALLPDIHLNEVCRDPADPANTWYAATDVGVFATKDAGANWGDATLALGLPLVQCNAIEAMDRAPAGTGFLNVATYGRGMWRIALPAGDPPRFTGSARYFRFGTFIVMQLTVVNVGGTANNVRVSGASIQPDRKQELVIPAAQLPQRVDPIDLDTVGTNQNRVLTVVYDNVAPNLMPKGTAVTYKVQFQYDGGTIEVKGRDRLP